MRIAFIISQLSGGGAEKQLVALLNNRPREIDASVILIGDPRVPVPELLDPSVGVYRVPRLGRARLSFFYELCFTIRSLRPDVLHTFLSGSSGTWGRLAGVLTRVPRLMHSERSLLHPSSRLRRSIDRTLDRATHLMFVNAHATGAELRSLGVPCEKIVYSPNLFDFTKAARTPSSTARTQYGLVPGDRVLGFLGRLRPEKRVDLLLSAVQSLPSDVFPSKILIGGDGPERSRLERQVKTDPRLRATCRFVGTVAHPFEFLSAIDLLVLPSDLEGTPNVLIEALSIGTPVVGSAVSDIPTIIGNSELLFPAGNVTELTAVLARVLHKSASELRSVAEIGKSIVEARFDVQRNAALFWSAHSEAL